MIRILLSISLSFFALTTTTLAQFDAVKFKAYLERMETEGKPATLIVGCGHKCTHHDHTDHWTVDMDDFDHAATLARAKPESMSAWGTPGDKHHATTIGADDTLDITVPKTSQRYKEKFDVVVFEHVNSVVSRYPISIANAVYMLKEGGKLFLEVRHAHSFNTYYDDIALEIYPDISDYNDETEVGTITYSELGIKGLEEDIKSAEESTKKAQIDYLDHVKEFATQYKVERRKNSNIAYMTRCFNALGLSNVIVLTDNSTYESPFSKQKTQVIYAEKKHLIDGSVFAKIYKVFNKYKAPQWTNPDLLKPQN